MQWDQVSALEVLLRQHFEATKRMQENKLNS